MLTLFMAISQGILPKTSKDHRETVSIYLVIMAPSWKMVRTTPPCQGLNWEDAMEPLREVSVLAVILVILYVPWFQLEQVQLDQRYENL